MRKLRLAIGGLLLALVLAQLVQPRRDNPPSDPAGSFEAVARPPRHAAAVIARSCADCHSHQTVWPWYSRVAPVSWLVAHDVKEGRARLNFSQWNLLGPEEAARRMRKACEEARAGEMPPKYYTPLHPGARLGAAGVAAICAL